MWDKITNIAFEGNFNIYDKAYSGTTGEYWEKPEDKVIKKEICKYYLINYAGWDEDEAEIGATAYGYNTSNSAWTMEKLLEDMETCKRYRENWDSGTTSVAALWRDDNWTALFFPKLDLSNVTNAERCWHSNYNCYFYPSIDLPLATNIAGMLYYQDCQYFCGDFDFDAITTVANNRFIFVTTRLRNKITITMPNLTSLASGLLQQTILDYVPTIYAPNLAKCGYSLFLYTNFINECDVFDELGDDLNWSGCTDYRWLAYGTTGSAIFDLTKIDFTSATVLTSMFYECSSGLTINVPSEWSLPAATSFNYVFCNAPIAEIGDINAPNVWDYECAFATSALTSIGTIDCTSAMDVEGIFSGSTALSTIGGLTNLGSAYTASIAEIDKNLDLSACSALTTDSVLNIFESIATLPDGVSASIILHSDVLENLTEDEIAVATNKGWTVSQ